jgi:hypothetical protein
MPNIADKTTQELLTQIGAAPLNASQQAALNEIVNNRIIKVGDSDDFVVGGVEATRGGVRPKHAPLI